MYVFEVLAILWNLCEDDVLQEFLGHLQSQVGVSDELLGTSFLMQHS